MALLCFDEVSKQSKVENLCFEPAICDHFSGLKRGETP
jgi:hypothetical protein